jgi:hypothetical protein
MTSSPNVISYHVDNVGFDELGCYGGVLRGADTARVDALAREGFQLRRRVNVSRSVSECGHLVWSTPKTGERRSLPFQASLTDEPRR